MNASLQDDPGIEPSFSQPIRDNVLESISQIDGQIVVKVFGEDMDVLRRVANDVLRTIAPVRGVARAFVDRGGQVPQLQIEIDRARAARYGLNVADVEDVIETALGGRRATELWEGERRFDVVVRLSEEERQRRGRDREHPRRHAGRRAHSALGCRGGRRRQRQHEHRQRVGHARRRHRRVHPGPRHGRRGATRCSAASAAMHLPSGYSVTWGGEFENQQRAMARLRLIVPISVLLIFVLLFNAFGSVKHAALILVNVPFALIGGILALYLTGIHLSVSAAIGFIALFGQAVLNGVVMVSYFNQLRRSGVGAYHAAFDRLARSPADGADDDAAGDAGADADGAVAQHRIRSAAAARGRDHRRPVLGRRADARGAAGAVCDVREAERPHRRSGDRVMCDLNRRSR